MVNFLESTAACEVTKYEYSTVRTTAALYATAMCIVHVHRVDYKVNQTTVVSSEQPTSQHMNTRTIWFDSFADNSIAPYGKQIRSVVVF